MTASIASDWREIAGWGSHPLENAAFAQRTPKVVHNAAARRHGYLVRCSRSLGDEMSFLNLNRSTKRWSGPELAHRFFVPFHACSEGVANYRHAFLNT